MQTEMRKRSILRVIFSAVTFIGIFMWLLLRCPQYLTYQEQNQLFLFTWNYLAEGIRVPGGFADRLSEFVVQFNYIPLYGALLTSLMLTLTQVALGLACRRCAMPGTAYALAALPPVLYLGGMGDENLLLSFAAAMLLTALAIYLATLPGKIPGLAETAMTLAGFCVLYWLAGPFAFVFIAATGILRRRDVAAEMLMAWLAVWTIHRIWFEQYPLGSLMLGINYYRIQETYPPILLIIAGVTAAMPLITLLKKQEKGMVAYAAGAAVAVFAAVFVPASYNSEKSSILEYDSLVRQGRWDDIIAKAGKDRPSDPFRQQALNLALGMRGQLAESMFQYPQQGTESLIGKSRLDNTSQLISAEALFRLGLTNIAFSTTFDLQEAIMNDRKSGRHTKRLAECMIVNGNYDVARKYINILKHSLFYRDWARKAEHLLDNDPAVESHPVYGPLRRTSFKREGFFDHTQLDKIMAMLAADSGGANTLAWQYFCAASLLKGDLATLLGVWNSTESAFGPGVMPRHVQEAAALIWTSGHGSFEGLPYPVSDEVKASTAALARAAMTQKDNPAAWEAAAPGAYGVYFLRQASRKQTTSSPAEYQTTHE